MKLDPLTIIRQYYAPDSPGYQLLVTHSLAVARKVLELVKRYPEEESIDKDFLYEAALLHDIGICFTKTPKLYCYGDHPYIQHGIWGRHLLETVGLPRHALVCERHIGVGLSKQDIQKQKLPLPDRDMEPISIEEELVCWADKFFTKAATDPNREQSLDTITADLIKIDPAKQSRLDYFVHKFGV